jgi:hypothetical protein
LANVKQIFSPETPLPNGTKLGRKHLCKFGSIWPSSFRGDFLIVANQKKELLLAAMFIGRMEPNEEAL